MDSYLGLVIGIKISSGIQKFWNSFFTCWIVYSLYQSSDSPITYTEKEASISLRRHSLEMIVQNSTLQGSAEFWKPPKEYITFACCVVEYDDVLQSFHQLHSGSTTNINNTSWQDWKLKLLPKKRGTKNLNISMSEVSRKPQKAKKIREMS